MRSRLLATIAALLTAQFAWAQPGPPPLNLTASAPIVVTPSGAGNTPRVVSCPTCGASSGNVNGTPPSTVGNLAVFNNTSATGISDGGAVPTTTGTGSVACSGAPAASCNLAAIADGDVLGWFSGGTGVPHAVTPATVMGRVCNLGGQIFIAGVAGVAGCVNASGTLGQVLTQTQPGGNLLPAWQSVPHSASYIWSAAQNVAADTLPLFNTPSTGTITSVSYYTGGTTPSFGLAITINGTNVTSCNGLTVNSGTLTTTTCTAANTFTAGQKIAAVISAVSGTPNDAIVQVNYTVP